MFVDEITFRARAGRGGDGVIRWLHLKGKEFGGPSGGNGGAGGDVIVRAIRDLNILYRYRGRPTMAAPHGESGGNNTMTGKDGAPLVIDVPIGSIVTVPEYNRSFELLTEGEEVVALKGGRGGRGNAEFKSSVQQYPDKATSGEEGEVGSIKVELQLIADAGIVGLPNAGKSSLLNALTQAKSKIGAYPFTTLEPHLGVFHTYVLADIPGLIEGASEGRGLGHAFLRHIKRTAVIIHCVSAEEADVSREYEKIRNELVAYDPTLGEKPEIIFLTKSDTVSSEVLTEKEEKLSKRGKVVLVSILDDVQMQNASRTLSQFLNEHL